jgi:hypothetical protein
VPCLLHPVDRESLPQQDRLVLRRRQRAETPFGERVLALAKERGLLRTGTRAARLGFDLAGAYRRCAATRCCTGAPRSRS